MSELETTIIMIGAGVSFIGVFFVVIAYLLTRVGAVEQRLQEYIAKPRGITEDPNTLAENVRVTGTFFQRVLAPISLRVIDLFGRLTPVKSLQNINHKLTLAGNPMNLKATQFFGIRVLLVILGITLALLINSRFTNARTSLILSLTIFLVFSFFPALYLQSLIQRRQEEIRRGLPDALDILSICTSAGLSFNQAMQRLSEQWKTPVGLEFGRTVAEMEIGISRPDALRNMVHRLEVAELSSFVAVVIQSEKMGMSMAEIMRSQADQMRIMRQFRAKEIAQKLPTKMMVPLALLILPALLIVVLVPALLQMQGIF